jgi:hypothetical protein
VAELFQQFQGFWLLLVFSLVVVAGFYLLQVLKKVASAVT